MSRVDTGQSALISRMKAANGRSVTYTPLGGSAVTVTAWVGRTVFASNLEGGARVEFGERDYMVAVADLSFTPQIGDRIAEVVSSVTDTFEIATPTTGEPAVRYSDQTRQVWRLHVKLVTTIAIGE